MAVSFDGLWDGSNLFSQYLLTLVEKEATLRRLRTKASNEPKSRTRRTLKI